VTQKDRLGDQMRDLATASGVQLRGPNRIPNAYGKYENQKMSVTHVTFEALTDNGEWEVLYAGHEREAAKFLQSAKRLIDIGKGTP